MVETRAVQQRLGTLSGGLTGLALAVGAWGSDILSLGHVNIPLFFAPTLVAAAAVVSVCALAGWLSAYSSRQLFALLIWATAASLAMFVVGHLPYEGRTLMAWLSDWRFWGLPIYLFDDAAQTRLVIASFFPVLAMAALGLVQDFRLESVQGSLNAHKLSARAWLLLLLPLPLVMGAGWAAGDIVNNSLRSSLVKVANVISVGGSYPGDLDALSEQTGLHYSAIITVRDRITGPFQLSLGEIDLSNDKTVVVFADFENGAWINCLVTLDRVSFCHDAQVAYVEGLQMLLAGQDISQCQDCQMQIDSNWQAWLGDRGRLTGNAQITRLGQAGGYVLMRAANPNGIYALDCMFQGNRTIGLMWCKDEK